MKAILTCILFYLIAFSSVCSAQFKPAEQQYLSEQNLVQNGGFEQGVRGWTNSLGTFAPNSIEKVEGNKSGCVTLTAQTLNISQTIASGYPVKYNGLGGKFNSYIKSDFDFEMCSLKDGIESKCKAILTSASWNWFNLDDNFGAFSTGFKLKTIGNVTGDICFDSIKIAHNKMPTGNDGDVLFKNSLVAKGSEFKDLTTVVFSVAQAEIIGSYLLHDNDCIFDRGSQPYGSPFAATSNCLATEITGNVTQPDVTKPTIRVPNAKIGTYEVTYDGMFYNLSNAGSCYFSISTSANYENQGATYSASTPENRVSNSVSGTFDVIVEGDIDFNIITSRGGTATTCRVYGSTDLTGKFTVKYFPPKETIVRQNQIADKDNVNSLTAIFSDTHVRLREDIASAINCTSNGSAGDVLCTWPTLTLTEIPMIDCTPTNEVLVSDSITCTTRETTLTQTRLRLRDTNSNVFRAIGYKITLDKSTADYNKSLMIYGQFEQIKSGNLSRVMGGTDAANHALTANVTPMPWVELTDTNNEWNGTQFIPKVDMTINILGGARFTASNGANMFGWVNGIQGNAVSEVNVSQVQTQLTGTFELQAGDVFEIRSNTSVTVNSAFNLHWLSISQVPTLESLVKNLNDDLNVKCQTKVLAANCVGIATCLGLTFNNLNPAKKYKLTAQLTSSTNTDVRVRYSPYDNNSTILRLLNATGIYMQATSSIFIPVGTELRFDNIINTTISGNGTFLDSWAELCELPSNYTTTTEF